MDFWKKTFPFILLNIFVSATTVLLVIWLTQNGTIQLPTKPTLTPIVTKINPSPEVPVAQSTAEKPIAATPKASADEGSLQIEGVFGAGELSVEYILIRNQSESPINLNGWSIQSSNGKKLDLPQLSLNKNGAVRLYSKHGTNTVIELYWNSDQALWASGSKIQLLDPNGEQKSDWQVP